MGNQTVPLVERYQPTQYGSLARQFKLALLRGLVLVAAGTLIVTMPDINGLSSPARAQTQAQGLNQNLIVMLGDSLTAGYGLAPEEAFPYRLEKALNDAGLAVRVANAGVSGDTSAGGRARVNWAFSEKPAYAIVALGANDALRGIDPKDTRDNLERIIVDLKGRGTRLLLLGMLAPPNLGKAYGDEFNRLYRDLAAKHAVPLYPFFLEGVAADKSLNQADGIHPNSKGVAVLVTRLMPEVRKLLGR